MYELITLNKEGKTVMKQIGRSRRKPALSFPKGKSRRQFARIINDGTYKELLLVEMYHYHNLVNKRIL